MSITHKLLLKSFSRSSRMQLASQWEFNEAPIAVVLENEVCLPFVMVQGPSHAVILGTTFINMHTPLKFLKSIETEVEGTTEMFGFYREPQTQCVNAYKRKFWMRKFFFSERGETF